jgi:hypothetical protein
VGLGFCGWENLRTLTASLVQNLIEDSDFFTLLLVNKSNDPS